MATTFYESIIKLCDNNGISPTKLAENIGKEASTASGWKKGAIPRANTIKLIADYFGVPVDYFKEDTGVTVHSVQDNHDVVGHTHIVNGLERMLTEQEIALIGIFEKLDVIKQAQLLSFAADLAK